jgi:hypothetical protein
MLIGASRRRIVRKPTQAERIFKLDQRSTNMIIELGSASLVTKGFAPGIHTDPPLPFKIPRNVMRSAL